MYVSIFLWVFACMIMMVCAVYPSRGSGARYGLTHFSRRPVAVLPHVAISHSSMASPYPLSFILTHEHTRSQVREPVRGAGAEVGKPPLFRDDKHLCKPSKQPLSFSLSLSKLSNSSTPTAAWTAVCLTPPKTSIQASTRDKSKWEIHHCRKSGLIKVLHGSSKYDQCLGRKVLRTAPLRMSWESRDCNLSKG